MTYRLHEYDYNNNYSLDQYNKWGPLDTILCKEVKEYFNDFIRCKSLDEIGLSQLNEILFREGTYLICDYANILIDLSIIYHP
jgi:hypothetical protein